MPRRKESRSMLHATLINDVGLGSGDPDPTVEPDLT